MEVGRELQTVGSASAVESFLALPQDNVLHRQSWKSREDLNVAILGWIEETYHRLRRQRGLGRMTPVEFETAMTRHAANAHDPTNNLSADGLGRPLHRTR